MIKSLLGDKYSMTKKKVMHLKCSDSNNEKKYISILLCIYMISVIIRFFIGIMEKEPRIMGDELSYTAMAYNFFKTGNFYSIKNYGVATNIPNVLYQFIISFAFYFEENFYIIIKLINSLLISSIILPGYMLLKEYMSENKAILYASITLLMPFNGISSLAMAENLFLPLFAISFYFSYKLITEYKNRYIFFSSFSIALLYLTKPHAIALILALIGTTCIIFMYNIIHKNVTNQKKIIINVGKVIIGIIVILFSITFLIKGEISVEALLGSYKISISNNSTVYPVKDFFKMVLAHITIISILYFIPITVCIYSFISGLRKKNIVNENKFILSTLSLLTFCAFLAMTIKFTVSIYSEEHFLRLHVRYYYSTFLCLYYTTVCFINEIKLNKISKVLAILGFTLIIIINYFYSLPTYASPWATLSDNMDAYWFSQNNKLIIFIVFVISVISLVKFIDNKNTRKYFITYYIIFSLVANIAIIENKIAVMNPFFNNISSNRKFIQGNILDEKSKVMIIDSESDNRTHIAFWLHYDYTDIKQISPNTKVTKEMIPEGTEYIIAFDEFEFEFDTSRKYKKDNKCYIIDIR